MGRENVVIPLESAAVPPVALGWGGGSPPLAPRWGGEMGDGGGDTHEPGAHLAATKAPMIMANTVIWMLQENFFLKKKTQKTPREVGGRASPNRFGDRRGEAFSSQYILGRGWGEGGETLGKPTQRVKAGRF